MAAPVSSTHRNLQTHQPFYPALDHASGSSTSKGLEYLLKTPMTVGTPTVPSGTVVGIKILDQTFPASDGNTIIINHYNRLAVTTDGINWTPVSTPGNVSAKAVLNVPNTTNYILETDTGMLYTSSTGLTWTLIDMNQSDDGFFNLLSFAGDYLWATSYTRPPDPSPLNNWNTLYASNDSGVTWTKAYELNGFDIPEGFRGIVYGYGLGVPV